MLRASHTLRKLISTPSSVSRPQCPRLCPQRGLLPESLSNRHIHSNRSLATLCALSTDVEGLPPQLQRSQWQNLGMMVATGVMLALSLTAPVAARAEVATPPAISTADMSVGVMKAPPQLESKAPSLTPEELVNIRIFQDNTPSVVNVTNVRLVKGLGFSLDTMKLPAGVGSGFIWDSEGHVVTNFHVIKGASEVKVTLLDQSTYTARVVGADADKDVAVLQLDLPPAKLAALKPVLLGSSEDLLVGQKVFAIGCPFGLDHTLTEGIISGVGRELDTGLSTIKNVIQTDAAINPGNSGGVLLDTRGRVIGINTAIADPGGKGGFAGIGFAIPISDVKGLVDQILQYGRVLRPALGVAIAPPQLLQQLEVEGVLILDVPDGSPASAAGIQGTYRDNQGRLILGDIITALDGKRVKSYKDLLNILDEKRVGDRIKVQILRGDKIRVLDLTLGERQLGRNE